MLCFRPNPYPLFFKEPRILLRIVRSFSKFDLRLGRSQGFCPFFGVNYKLITELHTKSMPESTSTPQYQRAVTPTLDLGGADANNMRGKVLNIGSRGRLSTGPRRLGSNGAPKSNPFSNNNSRYIFPMSPSSPASIPQRLR